MNRHDVIVVGAGPAGSAVATLLATSGHDVVLLDRAQFPRDKACAEYCSPGVEDVLRRLGAWDAVTQLGPQWIDGMRVYGPHGACLSVSYSERGVARQSFALPRLQLDHALLRHALICGSLVQEGWRVTGVERTQASMLVQATNTRGQTATWQARVVVGADGLHSPVARSLGVRIRSHWPYRLGLVTHYADVDGFEVWGEMHVGRGLYCGLAPLPQGRVNVGLVVPLAWGKGRGIPIDVFFQRALEQLPAVARRLRRGRRIKPIRGMGPMTRHVERVAGFGYLLVGDAAGFFDPFTGEGIYRALHGAELAARVIDHALRTDSSAPCPDLSSYQRARRAEFTAKELLTWIIQLAMTYPPLFNHLCQQLTKHEAERVLLGNVLGDCASAAALLHPRKLAALLCPW
jgi:geranylgeranyl reductase family protein